MARFHQQVQTLLEDVEAFLQTSLKSMNLPRDAQTEKQKILTQISDLRKDYPQLGDSKGSNVNGTAKPPAAFPDINAYELDNEPEPPSPGPLYEDTEPRSPPPKGKKSDPKSPTAKYFDDDNGHAKIKHVNASELSNKTKEGYLKKKKVLGKGKVMCVIADGIFYVFEKPSSKKQMDAFYLKGYEASSLNATSKNDFPFRVTKPGGTTHQFSAQSAEDRDVWIRTINGTTAEESRKAPAPAPTGTEYEDTEGIKKAIAAEEEDNLYEDTGDMEVSRSPPPKPIPSPREGAKKPVGGKSTPPPPQRQLPHRPVSEVPGGEDEASLLRRKKDEKPPPPTSPPPPHPASEIYDDTQAAETEDYYDDDSVLTPRQFPPGGAGSSVKRQDSDLSSAYDKRPMLPHRTMSVNIDYSVLYYGLWDCKGNQPDELSFKRGDIIQIVNKDYDKYSWWVGKLKEGSTIGLVPKDYLTRAYEPAHHHSKGV